MSPPSSTAASTSSSSELSVALSDTAEQLPSTQCMVRRPYSRSSKQQGQSHSWWVLRRRGVRCLARPWLNHTATWTDVIILILLLLILIIIIESQQYSSQHTHTSCGPMAAAGTTPLVRRWYIASSRCRLPGGSHRTNARSRGPSTRPDISTCARTRMPVRISYGAMHAYNAHRRTRHQVAQHVGARLCGALTGR